VRRQKKKLLYSQCISHAYSYVAAFEKTQTAIYFTYFKRQPPLWHIALRGGLQFG